MTPSSSRPSVPRSASATGACPASTRWTCPRTCCAALARAHRASTRRWSTTSSGAASARSASRPSTSPATRCCRPAGPRSVPGTTVDRQCGSSQQAVPFAAAGVIAGHYDMAVAGGVESMSRVPMGVARPTAWPVRLEGFRGALRRRVPQPGHRRGDDRRAVGLSPRRSWTSSASDSTRRPRPPGRAVASPRRSPRSRPRTASGRRTTRASAAAARSSRSASLKPAFTPGRRRSPPATPRRSATARRGPAHHHQREGRGARPDARSPGSTPRSSPATTRSSCSPARSRRPRRRSPSSGLSIDDIGAFEVNEAFASVPLAWLAETRRRPGEGSTRTAAPSRSATRSAAPAPG